MASDTVKGVFLTTNKQQLVLAVEDFCITIRTQDRAGHNRAVAKMTVTTARQFAQKILEATNGT